MPASETTASGDLDVALVRRLIAAQFPHWADLPIRPVEPDGWDNRTFRLGDQMSGPPAERARLCPQVKREHRWLPELAPQLPLPIPEPIAKGAPGEGYPWSWSVYRWQEGSLVVVQQRCVPCDTSGWGRWQVYRLHP